MRYLLLFTVMVFSATFTNAQNYLISFAGSGASTTVSSVKVENLMSGASLTLSGTDILRLTGTTNINALKNARSSELAIYPNPNDGDAYIQIYPPLAGSAQIKVFNMSGNIVAQFQKDLDNSLQEFRLTGISKGFYFVQVTGKTYNYSGKIISNGNKADKIAIEEMPPNHFVVKEKPEPKLKNAMTTIDMAYSNGDKLKFTGSSGAFSTVIVDTPTENKTITFTFIPCTDFNENNYPIVQIGTQIWMGENLKVTNYRTGHGIPEVTDGPTWATLTTGAFCNQFNNPTFGSIYGRLYNFYAVTDNRGLCPTGWHIPSDSEWAILQNTLGGQNIAGGKLKETGGSHWDQNFAATNETGFTALPGGYRYNTDGKFIYLGAETDWWTSTVRIANYAWYYTIPINSSGLYQNGGYPMTNGFSVRCLKDNPQIPKAYPNTKGELYDFMIDGDTLICEQFDTVYIFQGDIKLTKDQFTGTKSTGIYGMSNLWPNGEIYYTIDPDFSTSMADAIELAISEYQSRTLLKFIKRIDEKAYVEFRNSETQTVNHGTQSELGYKGKRQEIWLEPSWNGHGTIMHEIGHTIGLVHEHSRSDRDNSVKIQWDNIVNDKSIRKNFNIVKNSFYAGNFDFGSIMLYDGFTSDKTIAIDINKPIITKSTGLEYRNYGQNLSFDDRDFINMLYGGNAPIADFTVIKDNIVLGENIYFLDRSQNNPTQWRWNFGDGWTSTEQNPVHKYNSTGIFSVTLKAINTSGSYTKAKVDYITVNSNQDYYSSDFSGDLSDWTQYGGTWQIQSGILHANYGISCGSISCPQADLILKDQFQPGGDWSASVDFTRATDAAYPNYSASNAQLALWVSSSKKAFIMVGDGGNNWGLTQLDSITVAYGEWNGTWYKQFYKKIGYNWLPTNSHKMTVEKTGNVYKIYVNDTYLWQYTDSYINGTGKIGLHTYGPKRYDNFVIKKPTK